MASRSINKVTLLGNLTRDPELKYTPSGAPVCTFGVATNRSWTTAEGQTKEETQYHRVTAWHKLAELCGKLLTKGRKVYLEGRLTYRNYVGKDGVQRNITEIILDDFIVFSDGKRVATGEQSTPSATPAESNTHADDAGSDLATDASADHSHPTQVKQEDETVNPDDIPF